MTPDGAEDAGKIILVSGRPAFASFGAMTRDLAVGFQALGQPTDIIWIDPQNFDQAAFVRRMSGWIAHRPRAILNWNAKLNLRPNNISLHDRLNLPLINLLVDAPAVHADRLRDLPVNHITTVIDPRHRDCLARIMPRATTAFLPHGGPEPDDDPPSAAERPIRLLLSGNLHPAADLTAMVAGGLGRPRDGALENIVARMAERCIEALDEPFTVALEELQAMTHPPPPATAWTLAEALTAPLAATASNTHRLRFLNGLGSIPATVIGEIDPAIPAPRRDSIDYLGPRPFDEVLALMRQTRVVVNLTPNLNHGSHERMFYGMAAGAVIANLPSSFLAENFADGQSLLFIDPRRADFAAHLGAAVEDAAGLDSLANTARPLYAAHHTWRTRAAVLLELLGKREGEWKG